MTFALLFRGFGPSLIELRPHTILVGSELDLIEDLRLAAGRRRHLSVANLRGGEAVSLFNRNELRRISTYVDMWMNLHPAHRCLAQDLIVHVGDNPTLQNNVARYCTWSATNLAIPTIRRSSGHYVAPFWNRQVLLKELYLSMGYAVYDFAAQASRSNMYSIYPSSGAKYSSSKHALGNSMMVPQVGSVATTGLCCSRYRLPDFIEEEFPG